MNAESIPASIRDELNRRGVARIEPMPPGMSGASVYRCHCHDGCSIALKQWPSATDARRVDEVHRIVVHARSNGCGFVPPLYRWSNDQAAGHRWSHGGRHWETMQWIGGEPPRSDASLDQIRSGASAIASFHRAVADLGIQSQVAPAVVARLNRLRELDSIVPQLHRQIELPPELAGPIDSACQLIRWRWSVVRNELQDQLERHADRPTPTQLVLRDVHRQHVLFEADRMAGLIDFDAIRVDTPLTDLARWAGGFVGGPADSDAVWQAAVAGFRSQWASLYSDEIDDEAGMARDLHRATAWISLANWLQWILLEQRSFAAGPEKVAARVQQWIVAASDELPG